MLDAQLTAQLNSFQLDLTFAAETGRTTVLLGESGAGKSTVLRLLAGLLHPQKGHISLDDTIYFDSEKGITVPPQKRPFGYVFQDYVLFPHLNVFENVAFGLRALRLPRRTIQHRVGGALERVHLTGYDTRLPTQLSGGQQQRVAIARALALQPQLLLLDEPLSALDVQTRREVRQELRRILAEVGITTIMVTHQYLEALLFGHSILVLDGGKLIQQGTQRDLLEHPRSAYIAELMGVNFFRGTIIQADASRLCTLHLPCGTQLFEVMAMLENHTSSSTEVPEKGTEVFAVVDPRSITLYPSPPDSSARNLFYGEIVQILPLHSTFVTSSQHDGRVRVSILVHPALPPLIAEVTEASVSRLQLSEGGYVYATFKATEARAYL